MKSITSLLVMIGIGWVFASGCVRPANIDANAYQPAPTARIVANATTAPGSEPYPTAAVLLPTQPESASLPLGEPTPDSPHPVPSLRNNSLEYLVKSGDTLMRIAQEHTVTLEQLVDANQLANPNLLSVNQLLVIPPPIPAETAPAFKILPNSELVYGPNTATFNVEGYILTSKGYLAQYLEEIGDDIFTGAQIVQMVAQNYSVNPRLLLAILEYQSGWLSSPEVSEFFAVYPIGHNDPLREGLYRQLAWAANQLNLGYYTWRVGAPPAAFRLADGALVLANPTVNAGTAAVHNLFSQLSTLETWQTATGPDGVFATYTRFFENPFVHGFDEVVPAGITQPEFQLPFEPGVKWYFTGGPHHAWDSGSAWSALDFAPEDSGGCSQSEAWVTAVADGYISRASDGSVVLDLDGDGLETTGWSVLYLHIATRGRVDANRYVQAGDLIGHPSCEGGISNGTHVHLARKYNGEWIPADQPGIPFIMDGWLSVGTGELYNGNLIKDGIVIEAWNGPFEINEISR